MNHVTGRDPLVSTFRRHAIVAGILLVITGMIGIFLPAVMALTVTIFIGWLLVFGGLVAGYHVYKAYARRWLAWLKPFILIVIGALILWYPLPGAAALGLLLAVYFMIDAFANFSMGFDLRPLRGWGWMLVNGVLSLVLSVIILMGWPFDAVWMVGLLIGISLFFDGVVLLVLGASARRGR